MEVIQILNSQGKSLTDEEIKFLIDELNTGDYDEDYKKRCFYIIGSIINKEKADQILIGGDAKKPTYFKIFKTPDEIKERTDTSTLNVVDKFLHDLKIGRTINSNGNVVSHYIKKGLLDKEYFLTNIKIFNEVELTQIFCLLQLDENEVEKYFKFAPRGIVEKYQFISEDFFIKYFDKISINLLKENKITPWVSNPLLRSNKIKIFIKMKGIKL